MDKVKQKIYNGEGKLLCEVTYRDGQWFVIIRRRKCHSIINLSPDGSSSLASFLVDE